MIVDTNALSAWRDGEDRLLQLMGPASRLALPVIVIGEARYGLEHSRERIRAQAWLNQIIRALRILPITVDTAAAYARVRYVLDRKGSQIPVNDTWIAALAVQHQLPVLSRDSHFDVVDGITRVSW